MRSREAEGSTSGCSGKNTAVKPGKGPSNIGITTCYVKLEGVRIYGYGKVVKIIMHKKQSIHVKEGR